jgi:hypothetical protein
MLCPECQKEMDEEFRPNIWSKIFVCTECGIMKWLIETWENPEIETWKRVERT